MIIKFDHEGPDGPDLQIARAIEALRKNRNANTDPALRSPQRRHGKSGHHSCIPRLSGAQAFSTLPRNGDVMTVEEYSR